MCLGNGSFFMVFYNDYKYLRCQTYLGNGAWLPRQPG